MRYGNRKLILLGVILLLVMVACSKGGTNDATKLSDEHLENLNKDDFPIVNDDISLDFMVGQHPATNENYNDLMIFNEYEDMTNVDIEWQMIPLESLEEKRNLVFAGGTLPDAIYSARFPENDLMKYGEQGLLIPLNDLIDEYAPNFKSLMEKYPEIKEALTMPDGNIYSLPMLMDPEFLSVRVGAKPFINQKVIDELNVDIPETLDEFYEFLKTVKEESTNKDLVPFGSSQMGTLFGYLRGSFGLANKGSSTGYIDVEPGTDELRFYPIADEYRDLLEYMHKLYDGELIEQNIFSIEMTQFLDNLGEGNYATTIWYGPEVSVGNSGEDYVGMPALEGPEGDKLWTTLYDSVYEHSFVITDENEYPAATIRWIDYFYGEEGMKLFYMGIEGETYELNDEGEPEYVDKIINNENGLSFEEAAKEYLAFPGGGYPALLNREYFAGAEGSEQSLKAAEKLEPDVVKDTWTTLKHIKEERDKLKGFGTDIEKYVGEMQDKFISGNTPISDEEWDAYVNEIKKMGLEDYMKIKQAAIDRQLEQ